MVLCGTKNGSSIASLEEPFEAPLFLRVWATNENQVNVHVYVIIIIIFFFFFKSYFYTY